VRKPLVTKIETPAAQGDGSYLEFRRPTWGERRKMLKDIEALEGPALEDYVLKLLFERLEGWNWQDAEGKELPLPKQVEHLSGFTDEEIELLYDISGRAIKGILRYTEDDEKN